MPTWQFGVCADGNRSLAFPSSIPACRHPFRNRSFRGDTCFALVTETFDQRRDFRQGARRTEQEPLRLAASPVHQRLKLLLCLDAFGDGRHIQPDAEVGDGLHDRVALTRAPEVAGIGQGAAASARFSPSAWTHLSRQEGVDPSLPSLADDGPLRPLRAASGASGLHQCGHRR